MNFEENKKKVPQSQWSCPCLELKNTKIIFDFQSLQLDYNSTFRTGGTTKEITDRNQTKNFKLQKSES